MKLSHAWGPILVIASIAAACSATADHKTFSGAGAGTGTGGSGANGGNGTGGGFSFGDAGPKDAAPDQSTGPTTCDASCGTAGGTCMAGTCVLTENPGNVSAGSQGMLKGGGTADPAFKWLYPYDKTVFPRGLIPPTLQFASTANSYYVTVTFPGMQYQGFYTGAASQLVFSDTTWKAITLAATGLSDVTVQVTKITGTAVSGPITEHWTIAQGSLRGTIYYETYDSQLAGGAGSVGIMQIQPGAAAPMVMKTGCGNVCHTASADGSTLVANSGNLFDYLVSSTYDLKNSAAVIYNATGEQFTYGGVYPDGSISMSATNYRTWLGTPSQLFDTHTGAQIPAPGWDGVIKNAGTVAYSPDGKLIAFNHEDTGAGKTLAVMNFDLATKTFSGLHDIASDPSLTLAWPAFTPDGKWVAYHAGSDAAFETDNGATGDVYYTSATTGGPVRLDALDGYANGQTYLPANDPNLSFAPTILPEAVGGYFWVVFTSHRSYGNILPSLDGPSGSPGEYGKLWVAAFDINPTPGKDPSHPAFFLDGQELHADNLRGFWVLDPCKQTSNACASGDECCTGFCRSEDGGPTQCVTPPMGCSNDYEKCSTAADCCNTDDDCINGLCAQPAAK
jgi:hypothetical protein